MKANSSITITPGTGETVSTHTADSKKVQVFVPADPSGDLMSAKHTWIVSTGNTANVAAARTTFIDLFNASGSGKVIKIWGIYIIPALTAVTGIGNTWEVIRTSAVGSGGTTLTPQAFDTGNTAIPAQVTCRSKPTGGATGSTVHQYINGSSEETSPYAAMASILNHVGVSGILEIQPITLAEGQGLKIDQTTNSAVGNTNLALVFTVE